MTFFRKFPYWYLLAIPVLIWTLGLASNQAVLIANHGKFPVMINQAQYEKFCSPQEDAPPAACSNGGDMIDPVHSIMGPNSHLKALADIYPVGGAIYSIGDVLLYLGDFLMRPLAWMWLALSVRKLAVRKED